jgi:hypothetical protein
VKKNYFNLSSRVYTGGLFIILALGISGIFTGCKKDQPAEPAVTETLVTPVPETPVIPPVTPPAPAVVPTQMEALQAIINYNNRFYNQYGTYGSSFKANYWKDENHTNRMDFWMQQEAIETLIDAYDINPSTDLKNKIQYLYNGVRDANGLLWTSNIYNDDIAWGVLMCLRAYKITNDGGMLDMAKNNFDMMWNRAWDTQYLEGGLWWTTANQTKKHLCKCTGSYLRHAIVPGNRRCGLSR